MAWMNSRTVRVGKTNGEPKVKWHEQEEEEQEGRTNGEPRAKWNGWRNALRRDWLRVGKCLQKTLYPGRRWILGIVFLMTIVGKDEGPRTCMGRRRWVRKGTSRKGRRIRAWQGSWKYKFSNVKAP
jgi:hypothetical protein